METLRIRGDPALETVLAVKNHASIDGLQSGAYENCDCHDCDYNCEECDSCDCNE